MHELMFQAGVKGMSERSELIPCNNILLNFNIFLTWDCNVTAKCNMPY